MVVLLMELRSRRMGSGFSMEAGKGLEGESLLMPDPLLRAGLLAGLGVAATAACGAARAAGWGAVLAGVDVFAGFTGAGAVLATFFAAAGALAAAVGLLATSVDLVEPLAAVLAAARRGG